MESFEKWCEHYDYDPNAKEAKEDYEKYCEQLNFFRDIARNNE
ncbi:hypothetical protein [Oceanisphaera sp. IT1-181]|nr:hypothetical protein [Oceanisphaera sp. IT1-181]